MKPDDQYFWQAIAESVAKEAPSVYCYIMDLLEMEEVTGFTLTSKNGKATVSVKGYPEPSRSETIYTPLELLDIDALQYKDPPGTFQGIEENAELDLKYGIPPRWTPKKDKDKWLAQKD